MDQKLIANNKNKLEEENEKWIPMVVVILAVHTKGIIREMIKREIKQL